ncbi:MAG TPA: serine/threonine-protein kinase, partial [Thermoanaerobaculia bacterium]
MSSSVSRMPTNLASPSVAEAARRRVPSSSVVGRLASSDSIDVGGFTPGTVLGERYRVIGLIGRGGMGEVYRADDLKLGQPVALKFLPDRLSSDAALLDRFFAEVRTARQVAHPNVCRVYDIGEEDGRHFISMEYVDGEDLASLLRRIGGLPQAKALEIARQLCAGLAAAHERNVLHRDLKPANVMVDGRGRARIMDFGLAVVGGEGEAGAELAGTPAYMAPEQFAGKGA